MSATGWRMIIASLAIIAASAVFRGSPAWAGGGPPSPPVTTVITHGFSTSEKGAWVEYMARAILARAGGGSIYRYTGASAAWTYVPVPEADGTNDAIVCIFNWVPESDAPNTGPNWNYVQAAGDAMYAALRDPRFVGSPIAEPTSLVEHRWLHLIGHSRGACVCSEAVIRFARDGLTVDHMTAHDPHPVNGTLDWPFNYNWNDPTPARWSNLAFLDNYWRADGGGLNALDFDGIPLAGAFNTELNESALNCCAYSLAHSDVHLWYHGTIDHAPNACDGEQCITQTMRDTWWPEGYTERGWYYSQLGGGADVRPAQGATSTPPITPYIVNGDFNSASHAGWSFHGGTVGGQIVNEGGATFLKLTAGNSGTAFARHNRMFVPAGAQALVLDWRVLAAGSPAGETLAIGLIDQQGVVSIVANVPIPTTTTGWNIDQTFVLPASLQRNRVYSLAMQITSPVSFAAVVGIDNLDLVVEPVSQADINADGCVNVTDLLAVIGAWGPCPAPPAWCPADVNSDGQVNVTDLLAVIGEWGCE